MKYYNDVNKQYHVGIAGMSTDYKMINSAYIFCMSGKILNKAHIEKLLDINPKSREAIKLNKGINPDSDKTALRNAGYNVLI